MPLEEPPLEELVFPEELPPDELEELEPPEELEPELPPPELPDELPPEETAGPPSCEIAVCCWAKLARTAGARMLMTTRAATPTAAAINAYSTAAEPARSRKTMSPCPTRIVGLSK